MTDTTSGPRVIAATVASMADSAAARYGRRAAARYKVGDDWRELTYKEAGRRIDEIALGLIELGIENGDRVCLLADTRHEWMLSSYGISAAGGVVVPVYPSSSAQECRWVAGNSGARAIICENALQRTKIEQVRDGLPELAHVIGIEDGGGELTLEELRASGRDRDRGELIARQERIDPHDAYTIVYTSGTTGPPKGVVLTHANATAVCEMVEKLAFVEPGEVTYLYLPLAHVYALLTQIASTNLGTTIVYYGRDTKQILPEIMATHPTYLPSVPRVFEKLYAVATAIAEQGGEEDRERFFKAIEVGVRVRTLRSRGEPVPPELEQAFDHADTEVFQRVRALFGGEVRQAVSGAAPIAPQILEFFYASGVPVLEGWGMTESVGIGTVGTLEHFKFGTVGRAIPGVEIQIAPEDGEILMRGPHIFREYWRNPEATAETLIDGWLHTGDLGELDDEGYLKITGRKKDIIITAGGKNLTPANLENDLKQSRFISHAVMYGDRRPYPVVLITLDPEEIGPWAREQGLPEDVAQLASNDEVHEMVQDELDRANSRYAQVEQIKKFTILDHDLSVETGELTPSLKVKRNVIHERYAGLFDAMY